MILRTTTPPSQPAAVAISLGVTSCAATAGVTISRKTLPTAQAPATVITAPVGRCQDGDGEPGALLRMPVHTTRAPPQHVARHFAGADRVRGMRDSLTGGGQRCAMSCRAGGQRGAAYFGRAVRSPLDDVTPALADRHPRGVPRAGRADRPHATQMGEENSSCSTMSPTFDIGIVLHRTEVNAVLRRRRTTMWRCAGTSSTRASSPVMPAPTGGPAARSRTSDTMPV